MNLSPTYRELISGVVPPVAQFVIGGVERERLHHIGAGPQKLPVQLPHCGQRGDGTRHRGSGTAWIVSEREHGEVREEEALERRAAGLS